MYRVIAPNVKKRARRIPLLLVIHPPSTVPPSIVQDPTPSVQPPPSPEYEQLMLKLATLGDEKFRKHCDYIKNVRHYLTTKTHREGVAERQRRLITKAKRTGQYILIGQHLYHRRAVTRKPVLVVETKEERDKILLNSHCATATHRGRNLTLSNISKHYWWRGMSTDVELLMHNCDVCLQQESKAKKPVPKGQPIEQTALHLQHNYCKMTDPDGLEQHASAMPQEGCKSSDPADKKFEAHLAFTKKVRMYLTSRTYLDGTTVHEKRSLRKSIQKGFYSLDGPHVYKEFKSGRRIRVIESKDERDRILLRGHCATAKHYGRNATLAKISNSVWWRGVSGDVEDLIERCEVCRQQARKGKKPLSVKSKQRQRVSKNKKSKENLPQRSEARTNLPGAKESRKNAQGAEKKKESQVLFKLNIPVGRSGILPRNRLDLQRLGTFTLCGSPMQQFVIQTTGSCGTPSMETPILTEPPMVIEPSAPCESSHESHQPTEKEPEEESKPPLTSEEKFEIHCTNMKNIRRYITTFTYNEGMTDLQRRTMRNATQDKQYHVDGPHLYYTRPNSNKRLLVIEDKDERDRIMWESHSATVSHNGRNNTLSKISSSYWWRGMTSDVDELIIKCDICRQQKRKQRKTVSIKKKYYKKKAPQERTSLVERKRRRLQKQHPTLNYHHTYCKVEGPETATQSATEEVDPQRVESEGRSDSPQQNTTVESRPTHADEKKFEHHCRQMRTIRRYISTTTYGDEVLENQKGGVRKSVRDKRYHMDGPHLYYNQPITKRPLLVIEDRKERDRILWSSHCSAKGHRGKNATLAKVTLSYWWRAVTKDITNLIENCSVCKQHLAEMRRRRPLPPQTIKPRTNVSNEGKPTTQKPTTQTPKTQNPKTQKPKTQTPKTQKPATQKPTTQNPATQKPATQKPTTQKPTTQRPQKQQKTKEISPKKGKSGGNLKAPGDVHTDHNYFSMGASSLGSSARGQSGSAQSPGLYSNVLFKSTVNQDKSKTVSITITQPCQSPVKTTRYLPILPKPEPVT